MNEHKNSHMQIFSHDLDSRVARHVRLKNADN